MMELVDETRVIETLPSRLEEPGKVETLSTSQRWLNCENENERGGGESRASWSSVDTQNRP